MPVYRLYSMFNMLPRCVSVCVGVCLSVDVCVLWACISLTRVLLHLSRAQELQLERQKLRNDQNIDVYSRNIVLKCKNMKKKKKLSHIVMCPLFLIIIRTHTPVSGSVLLWKKRENFIYLFI